MAHFIDLWTRFGRRTSPQPWTWDQQLRFRTLLDVLRGQRRRTEAGAVGAARAVSCQPRLCSRALAPLPRTCRDVEEGGAREDPV